MPESADTHGDESDRFEGEAPADPAASTEEAEEAEEAVSAVGNGTAAPESAPESDPVGSPSGAVVEAAATLPPSEAADPEQPTGASTTEPSPKEARTEEARTEEARTEEPKPQESSAEESRADEPLVTETLSPELRAIHAAMESKERVQGVIIGWNKGGFHVNLDGTPAFCPKSQLELGNPKRASAYVDRSFEFRVLDIKEQGKRIVVSRRELLAEDRETTLATLKESRASGEPVSGRVVSLTDFGAFVDVGGGVEGLVHLSQLSRRRVEHPRELVQIGQEVQVKVLKIEKGGERVSLSMKALEPDPWNEVESRYPTGESFTGTVLRKTDFGLFVDMGDGIEGLVHTSQLELGKSVDDYESGTEIEGWIREADGERRRLALSLREVAKDNPWSNLSERYSEGDEVSAKVEQVAKFGVFLLLEPGLSGLLPFSSLSLPEGSNPRRLYRPGQEMKVVINSIDTKRRRLALAPLGARLEGTRSDYKNYQKKQRDQGPGLNAMAAAFGKLREQ